MKYITYMNYVGCPSYVTFDNVTEHKQMSTYLRAREFLGAGFAYIVNNKFECHGESVSLDLKSRGQKDSDLINRLNEIHGV